jgi:flagellar P-ring protein precursor FlgI
VRNNVLVGLHGFSTEYGHSKGSVDRKKDLRMIETKHGAGKEERTGKIEYPERMIWGKLFRRFFLCAVLFTLHAMILILVAHDVHAARIKDLGYIGGVRPNQLIGYGLVVGLDGTGDKSNTVFTNQSLSNLLDKMGVRVDAKSIKVNNVAAVLVTADLQPFARIGNKIDALVSSIGDAKSLQGGVLLFTSLKGADGDVYAVGQGPVVVGGFVAAGQGAQIQKNHLTVGRVVNGTTIEKEIKPPAISTESVTIALKAPDFTTARRITEKINSNFMGTARARDGGTVVLTVPEQYRTDVVKFISLVEGLEVDADRYSKVVVNERTGTVVMGENFKITTVAISHGNITVQIKEDPRISQPLPFAKGGETTVVPQTEMRVEEEKGKFFLIEGGVTMRELVGSLNALGISARDIISVLQAIKAAGALQAELEVL